VDIKEDEVTLDQLDYLKKNFWYKTIPRVCNLVKYHLDEATKYLNEASVIKDKTLFLGMIDSLDKVRLQTLKERRDVLDFIKYYK
jgi:hypothetical protein